MRRKYAHLITLTCLFLLIIPMVYAPSQPVVMDVGSLVYRDIIVDGSPEDWNGIAPLSEDPPNDGNNDFEEIIAVYGANNDEFLFFLMEFKEVGITASVKTDQNTTCRFYIDILPGGDPSENFADYYIYYKTDMVTFSGVYPPDQAILFYWTGSFWSPGECTMVHGASADVFVEVAVAWECIGGINCFNSHFSASAIGSQTDFVPDHDALHDVLGCCPGERYVPVGGEINPGNAYILQASSLLILTIVVLTGFVYSKRKIFNA